MTDDRYICLCEIARGGLGTVELALRQEQTFERLFALKRPREHVRDHEATLASFLREARVAGMIRHENVVSALDVGQDTRGPFLVMDYVEGFTLGELITAVRRRDDLVPVSVALQIAKGCADGLAAAHELRDNENRAIPVVHRDISPQNIMVDFDGTVKVLDFGIAKAMTTDTTSEFLKGKIGYMSPEQLRFEKLGPRSDLFSLGVVLFETLAGRRLFRAETLPEAARRTMHESTPDIGEERGDISPALVALLFRMLHKDPEQRPGSAREVSNALDAVSRSEEVEFIVLSEWIDEELAALKAERTQRRVDALAGFREGLRKPSSRQDAAPTMELAPTTHFAPTVIEPRPSFTSTEPADPAPSSWASWRIGAALLVLLSVASLYWLMQSDAEPTPVAASPEAMPEHVEETIAPTAVMEAVEADVEDVPRANENVGASARMNEESRSNVRMRSTRRTGMRSAMRAGVRTSGMRASGMRASGMRAVTEDWW